MNLQFLLVDPQNDFAHPQGNLFVPHADIDSQRLASLLQRLKTKITQIHVTLDTHHWVDIAHPIFWINKHGQHPNPFTVITEQDVLDQKWTTTRPDYQTRATQYVQALTKQGRYQLTIWPPHCLIGKPGHNVVTSIAEALTDWEKTFAIVNYVTKGTNIWTEHYSAIQAEVRDPHDPTTHLNTSLIDALRQADLIAISGQALSHCVANTVRDLADHWGQENMTKMVLIQDTTSNVPGFEHLGEQFLAELTARGMQTVKSTEFGI